MYKESHSPRIRYCQPDGLLFSGDLRYVIIIEIKLRHTAKAWWQLKHKYAPILKAMFPWIEVRYVEFTRWYDLATEFPEAIVLREDVSRVRSGDFQVTIWRP